LQQIQEADFYKAIDVARKVVDQEENINFVFAFKPETYKEKYSEEEGTRIKIVPGLENFGDVLEAANFFFSPIGDKSSTVSPPLTWLEAMAKGTPIITTDIQGVDELITNGINGFVAQDYEDLPGIILSAVNNTDSNAISMSCINKVVEDFDIRNSAESYLQMWRSLINS
jgi:glycosyltransferase involved in cell wall biosynthesis